MRPQDIGAHIYVGGAASSRALAGGTGDATEVNGEWLYRRGFNSASAWVAGSATLAEAATITIAGNLQDADDSSGTNAADFGTAYSATTAATGDTGGTTEYFTVRIGDFDLTTAGPYVRIQYTPNLSAANTDLATTAGFIVLGGADTIPAALNVL